MATSKINNVSLNTSITISDNTLISLNSGLALHENIYITVWGKLIMLRFVITKTDQSAFTGSRVSVGSLTNSKYYPSSTFTCTIVGLDSINMFNNRSANMYITNDGRIFIDLPSQDIKELSVNALYLTV